MFPGPHRGELLHSHVKAQAMVDLPMTSQKLHYLSSYAKGPSAGTRHQVAAGASQSRRIPDFGDDSDDDVPMEDAPIQTINEPSMLPPHSPSAPSLHRFDAAAATRTPGSSAGARLRRSSRLAVIPEAEEEEIITTSDTGRPRK